MKTTKIERRVLQAIAYDDMTHLEGAEPGDASDTRTPINSKVWANEVGVSEQTLEKALASLSEKGVLIISDHKSLGELDDVVEFSTEGFKAWRLDKPFVRLALRGEANKRILALIAELERPVPLQNTSHQHQGDCLHCCGRGIPHARCSCPP